MLARMGGLSTDGRFWMPDRPDRLVPGVVTTDDGVTLRLDDSLRGFEWLEEGAVRSASWTEHPVVHGVSRDGQDLTLLGLAGLDMSGPFGRIQEVHHADALLVGGHAGGDAFEVATATFDLLPAWLDPGPVSQQSHSSLDAVVVPVERRVLVTATVGAVEVKVVVGVEGRADSDRVELAQICAVEIRGPAVRLARLMSERLRPVHDFLIVALGRPCRMTGLQVRLSAAGERDRSLEVHTSGVQPAVADVLSVARARNYDSPVLHLREHAGDAGDVLERWYAVHDDLREVVDLLTGPFHAPFTYVEHRYGALFQSAEAYAKRRHGGKEKTKMEHRERVAAVTDALAAADLPEDVVGWATRILQGRNDRSLPQMVDALAASCGQAGGDLLTAAPGFARQAAALRAGVAHGGSDRPDPLVAYWHGEALLWLMRIALLAEAGVPVDRTSARAATVPSWKRAVNEIAARAAAQAEGSAGDPYLP
jgi:hypothetical protein